MKLKKLFCLLLCMTMLMSFSPFALADGGSGDAPASETGGSSTPEGGSSTPEGGSSTPEGGSSTPEGGETDPAGGVPEHTHNANGTVTRTPKDEINHTVSTPCLDCPESYAATADEAHVFENGACVCTYHQAASLTLADGTTVTYYNSLKEVLELVDEVVTDEQQNQSYKYAGCTIKLLRDVSEDELALTGAIEGSPLELTLDLNGKTLSPKTQSNTATLSLSNVQLGLKKGAVTGSVELCDAGFVVDEPLESTLICAMPAQSVSLPVVIATGSAANPANFCSVIAGSFAGRDSQGSISIMEGSCLHENAADGVCPVCGSAVIAPAAVHQHSWSYTAAGNVLSASCAGCPDYASPITMTLTAPEDLVYNAAEKAAGVTYSTEGVHTVTVSYDNTPKNVGTYTASITLGEGDAAATAELDFDISPASAATSVSVTAADTNAVYNGRAHEPAVTVSGIGSERISADDYTLTYDDNINAGTAKAKISFNDGANYSGSAEDEFTITAAKMTITAKDLEAKTGTEPSFSCSVNGLVSGDKFTTLPTYRCAADMTETGIYEIVPENADAGTNYTIEYVPGMLYVKSVDSLQYKAELKTLSTVAAGLADTDFNTVSKIKSELQRHVIGNGYTASNSAAYELTAYISLDGGSSWIELNDDNFPLKGITVTLPYPTNTSSSQYSFKVSHMFAADSQRLGTEAGDVEVPTVTETSSGLSVKLNGLSPVLIAWYKTGVQTGDNANIPLWASLMCLAMAAHVATIVVLKKRFN